MASIETLEEPCEYVSDLFFVSLQIEEEGEERLLHLTAHELRKVLCEQLCTLFKSVGGSMPLAKVEVEYARHFGFGLKMEDFHVGSARQLLLNLKTHFKVKT